MVQIISKIKLFSTTRGRKTSFKNGYRPMFNFITETKTSGQITLIDREDFYPGEEGIVKILFLNKKYLGFGFGKGTVFTFQEGKELLGEGEVLEVLD